MAIAALIVVPGCVGCTEESKENLVVSANTLLLTVLGGRVARRPWPCEMPQICA